MQREYVRLAENVYRIGDTRVSLDSLIHLFREGMSAEGMVESYPALTLEQVHGALAFYLGNQREIDAYLAEGERTAQSHHEQSRRTNSELIAKLQRARDAAVSLALENEARFVAGVKNGMASADRGDLLDHESVATRIEKRFGP
jgi:uncharacterized protein (DUF433 family)/predicted transcriptional regulator